MADLEVFPDSVSAPWPLAQIIYMPKAAYFKVAHSGTLNIQIIFDYNLILKNYPGKNLPIIRQEPHCPVPIGDRIHCLWLESGDIPLL